MNLSKTRVVIVGAGQAGSRAGRFTTLSIRGNEVVRGIAVNAARDMSVLRRLVASRKTIRRSDLESPEYQLMHSLG